MPLHATRRAFLNSAASLPFLIALADSARADAFADWAAGMRKQAAAEGVSQPTLQAAFANLQPLPDVLVKDKTQPEFTLTFAQYIAKVVTDDRVKNGQALMAQYGATLKKVSAAFGVQPRFIMALWAVESDYGKYTGGYSVIAALATLAYGSSRKDFFRKELMDALRIVDQGNVSVPLMTGSWAGAMGQCQFMPSTFLSYAVDFDGDGRRNIWTNRADVLGSIANYISRLGWRGNEGWGREVVVPSNFDARYTGLDRRYPVAQWSRLGLRPAAGGPFTGREPEASLVMPDGAGGTGLLVYDNFRTIMRWNKSTYFAAAVGYIADGIDRS
jgi:peptidoglycan lytic transglycosylase B